MATLKKLMMFLLSGALIGTVAASLIAPRWLSWYHQPGGGSQAMCNCVELSQTVANSLLMGQLGGAGIGAFGFLILGIMYVRSQRLKQQALAAKAAPPSTPQLPPAAS